MPIGAGAPHNPVVGPRGDSMTNEEQILAVLTEIRDAQRQALLNQEKALATQQLAIDRQKAHIALYRGALIVGALIVAGLLYVFLRVARPYW